jgi:hypothetical protein
MLTPTAQPGEDAFHRAKTASTADPDMDAGD